MNFQRRVELDAIYGFTPLITSYTPMNPISLTIEQQRVQLRFI